MAEILVLRLVHVLGGVFWVGAAVFNFVFLAPAVKAAGPAAAGPIMGSFQQRRLFVILPTIAVLTILSGLRLMWITSGGFQAAYFTTGYGATFTAAGAAAIIAWLIGITIVLPAQKRLGGLGASMATLPDDAARGAAQAEMARLQRRLGVLGPALTVLLLLAAAGMAIGRYVTL